MAIVVNKPLHEFEANATGGIKVTNTSHHGRTMVLYFYPKDNTPGCTTEAMQFRDKYKDFVKARRSSTTSKTLITSKNKRYASPNDRYGQTGTPSPMASAIGQLFTAGSGTTISAIGASIAI